MALEHEEALMELSQQCIEASHTSIEGELLEKAGIAIQVLSSLWATSEQRNAEMIKVPQELVDGICAMSSELERELYNMRWRRSRASYVN